MFQSSPAPKDGRYPMYVKDVKSRMRFQSSPAPKDGRYIGTNFAYAQLLHVSILARPEGRALQLNGKNLYIACWFQSSPAPKDGRYRLH